MTDIGLDTTMKDVWFFCFVRDFLLLRDLRVGLDVSAGAGSLI